MVVGQVYLAGVQVGQLESLSVGEGERKRANKRLSFCWAPWEKGAQRKRRRTYGHFQVQCRAYWRVHAAGYRCRIFTRKQ